MNVVYLLLGGNVGDAKAYLQKAIAALQTNVGVVLQQSALYETAAWGVTEQPNYINQAVCLQTNKTALKVLKSIQQIENNLERKRTIKYGERTIDIDILFFNNDVIDLPNLTIPHPQIQNRKFVLIPLKEIAPNYQHPILLKTPMQLLSICTDILNVQKIL